LVYLFLECTRDHARSVLARLKRVPGVRDAHIVMGHYDIVAILEASSDKALGEVLLSKVLTIPDLHKTITNLAVG
jgi:DNA-binding Lrp family transcriptional regulator